MTNLQRKGRNSTSMETLLETEEIASLVFVNSSYFQIWYLENWIFTSIERELHVSTPYEFLVLLTSPIRATECTSRSQRNDSLLKSKVSVIASSLAIEHLPRFISNKPGDLGPLHMSPVTGLARLVGRILSSVHMGNFSSFTEINKAGSLNFHPASWSVHTQVAQAHYLCHVLGLYEWPQGRYGAKFRSGNLLEIVN